MTLLDKKYSLTINLEDSTVDFPKKMSFFNTDKNIANLYVKIQYRDVVIKYLSKEDAINYKIKLTVIKPKSNNLKEVEGIITNEFEEDYAIYKFELPSEFTDQVGLVVCEFVVTNSIEELTIKSFSYTIEASKVTGLNPEIIPNPDLPVLKQLLKDVKSAQQWISNIDDTKYSEVKTYSSKKIEDKINEVITKYNVVVDGYIKHISDTNNPHQVTALQTGFHFNPSMRPFKPKFDRILYFAMSTDLNGNFSCKSKEEILSEIKKFKELGIDGIYIIVHISVNTSLNKLYVTGDNYLDLLKYIIEKSVEHGLELRALKVHCEQSDDQLKLETIKSTLGVELFKQQYKEIIKELVEFDIIKANIDKIIIFNELPYIYGGFEFEDFCIDICNFIKSNQYNVSISVASIEDIYILNSNVIPILDFYCINFYPPISYNGLHGSISDNNSIVLNTGFLNCIKYLKQFGKYIYISETGLVDIEGAMATPWNWWYYDMTLNGGLVQKRYLDVIFDLFKSVNGVCYWWDIDISLSDFIKYNLGKVVY